jgi:uncharacterized protein YutE (UPF0331/DUF86 family)
MDTKRLNVIKQSMEAYTTSTTSRGAIIDLAIIIENTLTDIIAWCFYPTKKRWNLDIFDQLDENGIILKATLLRRLEFSDKIDILKMVISAKNLLQMAQHKDLIVQITTDLNHIRKFRNLLAHSPLDLSVDSLKSLSYETAGEGTDNFQIIEYKRGKAVKHKIDISRIKSEMKIMMRCWYRLIQLFALLKGDTEDARASEILSTMTEEEMHYVLKHMGLKD